MAVGLTSKPDSEVEISVPVSKGKKTPTFFQRWIFSNTHAGAVRTRFTREGFHILFVLAFVLVGAVLREVNLLVLLGGLMVGMLLLQWRYCKRSMLHLTTRREIPPSVLARQVFEVRIQIFNPRRLLPSWLVIVEDSVKRIEPVQQRQATGTTVIVPQIAPGGSATASYRCQLDRRGLYRFGPVQLGTQFPLGLMRATTLMRGSRDLIVQPRIGKLTNKWQALVSLDRQGLSKTASHAGVNEGEFYGLRTWQHGDSRRWIHWRTTARLGELAVRQFEQQQRMNIAVVLDLWQADNAKSEVENADVEKAVSFMATLAQHVMRQGNHRLAVAIAGKKLKLSSRIQSRAMVSSLLDVLAVASPGPKPDLELAISKLLPTLVECHTLLVISTRASLAERMLEGASERGKQRAIQHTKVRWLNVAAGDLDPYFIIDAV